MKALPKKQCINCEYLRNCWYPKTEKGNETIIHNCQDYKKKHIDNNDVNINNKINIRGRKMLK